MKNKIRIFAAVITIMAVLFSFCVPAFADMGSPSFYNYEVTVTKSDGISVTYNYYNHELETWEKRSAIIAEGEKMTVTGEYYNEDGEFMLIAQYDDSDVEINSDDVAKTSDVVDESQAFKASQTYNLVSINKDGAPIRKGPSEFYDEIAKIPFGEKITCDKTIADNSDGPDSWGYITYNGKSGWINLVQYGYNYDFATALTSDSGFTGKLLVVEDDVKLLDSPKDSEQAKVLEEIPAGTELSYDTYYTESKSNYAYTEYNGEKGWVLFCENYNGGGYKQSCAIGQNIEIISSDTDGIKLYSEPYNKGEFLGEYLSYNELSVSDMNISDSTGYTMEKYEDGEEYESYYYVDSYRVTVNDKTGWITPEDGFFLVYGDDYEISYCSRGVIKLYTAPDTGSEVYATIPALSEISDRTYCPGDNNGFMYVSYNGKNGWIKEDEKLYDIQNSKCMSVEDIQFYEEENGTATDTIPVNTEFLLISDMTEYDSDEILYYIEYNGKYGFIKTDLFAYSQNIIYTSDEYLSINDSYDMTGYEIGQIPDGEEFTELYEYYGDDDNYAYIEYNGIKGWVLCDGFNFVRDITDESEENEETAETAEPEEQATGMSAKNIIICCVAVAIILCAGAGVTLLYINKKKKANEAA